jgi:hypothetical protein
MDIEDKDAVVKRLIEWMMKDSMTRGCSGASVSDNTYSPD